MALQRNRRAGKNRLVAHVPAPHRVTTLPGLAGWWGCQPTLDAKNLIAPARVNINEVQGQMLIVTCPEIPDSGLRRTSQRTFRAPKTRYSEKVEGFYL
jgi:hypothetical protein